MKKKENTVRQRLREWYLDAKTKKGANRCQLKVESSFSPLLKWILRYWKGTQLVIAMDATTLGDRFTILAISVVYRSCAIPVAWKILLGNRKHPWNPEWEKMLDLLLPAVPEHIQVLGRVDEFMYNSKHNGFETPS